MADNDYVTREALKQELGGLETKLSNRFAGRMDAMEQRLNDHFDRRLDEKMRDLETRLLNAFYGFAETNNRKLLGI